MIEYKMNNEEEMTYYGMLTKKMRKIYVKNSTIESIKSEIKARSRLLYNREMKSNAYLGQRMILDIVSEKVAREVKAINDRWKNPDSYNRVAELYGLERIKKDSDYKRMMKDELQFQNEHIAPRLHPTKSEINRMTDDVVEY
ncbi:hypothetical protein BCV33_21255 [Vibrio lentus]|uniref:hypothetical protein n=1 Tax=Vibrio TaxID=662 RepID=UPI000C81F697|nr:MULTISPECIES: hypothetical protein [Vibrio]PME61923.1 hypothetical protein BCV33_21255 [Vibrio lentus]